MDDTVLQAIRIVNSTDWSGDWRVNMTFTMSAGRILALEIERLNEVILKLRKEIKKNG